MRGDPVFTAGTAAGSWRGPCHRLRQPDASTAHMARHFGARGKGARLESQRLLTRRPGWAEGLLGTGTLSISASTRDNDSFHQPGDEPQPSHRGRLHHRKYVRARTAQRTHRQQESSARGGANLAAPSVARLTRRGPAGSKIRLGAARSGQRNARPDARVDELARRPTTPEKLAPG